MTTPLPENHHRGGREFASMILKPFGRRLQLIEFHEESWCPAYFRSTLQDILGQAWAFDDGVLLKQSAAQHVAHNLVTILREAGTFRILDLCSGAGGPIATLANTDVLHEAHFELSDLYPNLPAFERIARASKGRVTYHSDPVDATQCQTSGETVPRVRTMFASMHHMNEDLLEGILRDCVASGDAFVAFEATNRTLAAMIFYIVSLPIILVIYIIRLAIQGDVSSAMKCLLCSPAVGFILVHDGVVSCLRTYSRSEFFDVASRADGHKKFVWHVDEEALKGSLFSVPITTYVGLPVARKQPNPS